MSIPYIIGIAGPSGSGKSTIAGIVAEAIGAQIFSLDSYYHELAHLSYEERCKANFDHPDSLDSKLLSEHLHALARGESIVRPIYDFSQHTRAKETERVVPGEYLIVEGIFALVWDDIRELYGTKVFVEAGHKLCLGRRIKRDIEERGRTEESVLAQYEATVRGMMDLYINPTKQYAHMVLSGDCPVAENAEKILEHVRSHKDAAEFRLFRLVNENHDPVEKGELLTRSSDKSHQKLGDGIYFAFSKKDAEQFLSQNHGHTYTHLLECRLRNMKMSDFVDLTQNPNLIAMSGIETNSIRDRNEKFCQQNNKKGIIWQAKSKTAWVEVLLLKQFVLGNVIIENSTAL